MTILCIPNHKYAEKACLQCGQKFCWECCQETNIHNGGKHQPDYMLCPHCNHDYYMLTSNVINHNLLSKRNLFI